MKIFFTFINALIILIILYLYLFIDVFLFYDSEKLQFLFYISIFLSVLNVCCANLDLFLYFIFTFEKHLKNGKYTSFIKKKFIHIYILTHFFVGF